MPRVSEMVTASFQSHILGLFGAGSVETEPPDRFDDKNPDVESWVHAYIADIDGEQDRDGCWQGEITVSVIANSTSMTNMHASVSLLETMLAGVENKVLTVWDYSADKENPTKAGYMRFFTADRDLTPRVSESPRQTSEANLIGRVVITNALG